jgi:hypothetical protein
MPRFGDASSQMAPCDSHEYLMFSLRLNKGLMEIEFLVIISNIVLLILHFVINSLSGDLGMARCIQFESSFKNDVDF